MTKEDDQRFFFDFNDSSMMVIRSFISNNRSKQMPVPNSRTGNDTRPRTIKRFDSYQDPSSHSEQDQENDRTGGEMTETESTEDCSSVCSDDTFARNTRCDGAEQRHLLLGSYDEDEEDDDKVYDGDCFGVIDSDDDNDDDVDGSCDVAESKHIYMKQNQVSRGIASTLDCDCSSVSVSSICSSESFQLSPKERITTESALMNCKMSSILEVQNWKSERSKDTVPSNLFIPLSNKPDHDLLDEDDSICSEVEEQENDNGDAILFAKKRHSSFHRMRNMLNSPRPSNLRKIANPKQGIILPSTIQSPIRTNRRSISPTKRGNMRYDGNRCSIFDKALSTPKAPQRQASWAHSSHKQTAAAETTMVPESPVSTVSRKTTVRFFDQVKVREFISDIQLQKKDNNVHEKDERFEVSMSLWDSILPDKFVPLREFIYVEGAVPYCLTPRSMKKKLQKRAKKKNKKIPSHINNVDVLSQQQQPPSSPEGKKKKKSLNTLLRLPFSPSKQHGRKTVDLLCHNNDDDDDYVSNDEDFSSEFRNVLHMIESAKDNIDQALLACEEKKLF